MSGKDALARRPDAPSSYTFTSPAARRLYVLRMMRDRALAPRQGMPAPPKSA